MLYGVMFFVIGSKLPNWQSTFDFIHFSNYSLPYRIYICPFFNKISLIPMNMGVLILLVMLLCLSGQTKVDKR